MKTNRNRRQRKYTHALIGLFSTLAAFIMLSGASAQTLMLKSDVTAAGSNVLLGEMLMDTAGIPDTWLERTVFEAPSDNDPVVYPITSVAYALQQYSDMKTASVSGSIHITITRSQRRIMPQELRRAIEEYVAIHESPTGRYKLEFAPLRRNVWVPRGEATFAVSPSRTARNNRQYSTYIVDVRVDDEPVCTIPVRAKTYEIEPVWVAARALDNGQLLSESDLRQELLPIERKGRKRVPANESIAGQELDRNVNQGEPILRNYLRTPLCAKKGDYITVTASHGTLKISLRAKALSTGRLGERILCMNERSKRQILVQLTGIQKARPAKL
jgi:flagella basal body P-ring formation protein FlgA